MENCKRDSHNAMKYFSLSSYYRRICYVLAAIMHQRLLRVDKLDHNGKGNVLLHIRDVFIIEQEDDENRSGRKSRDESLSISGLVLCCYLRRWSSMDEIDDDESTAVTQTGTSDSSDRNIRRSFSETSFQSKRHHCSKITYSRSKFDNAVFENTTPENSPPKEDYVSIAAKTSSDKNFHACWKRNIRRIKKSQKLASTFVCFFFFLFFLNNLICSAVCTKFIHALPIIYKISLTRTAQANWNHPGRKVFNDSLF